MKLSPLRILLAMDAALLFLLGLLLILSPKQVELAFHFKNLPDGVNYIIGLWGCILLTMAPGYAVAAMDPVRHVVWVQIGIARGAFECLLGAVYLCRGTVTWQQAGFGIVVAAIITAAYLIFYPRRPRVVQDAAPSPGPNPSSG